MTSSAIDRLGELEARVEAAKQREHGVGVERGRARREAGRAASYLRVYEEAVGAGEREPDEAHARELREAVRGAQEALSDDAWAARQGGATRAREEAERERGDFGRLHFAELAAELSADDPPARDRLQAAHEELLAAESGYVARVREWVRVGPLGGLSAADVPSNPLSGSPDEVRGRFAAGIEPPTPRALRDGADDVLGDALGLPDDVLGGIEDADDVIHEP